MGILNAKAVEQQIRECVGNLAAVARVFGVTRAAVHKFVKSRPALLAACRDCRELMKDEAESALYKAVREGEPWAVTFYLKTQSRDRGYSEKFEHEHAGEKKVVEVVEVVVRSREEAAAVLALNGPNGHGAIGGRDPGRNGFRPGG